jgi:hypothetical protein
VTKKFVAYAEVSPKNRGGSSPLARVSLHRCTSGASTPCMSNFCSATRQPRPAAIEQSGRKFLHNTIGGYEQHRQLQPLLHVRR